MKKMRIFQRVWSRIIVLFFSGLLSVITLGQWVPATPVQIGIVFIISAFGIWAIIWEYLYGDKRKLCRDGPRFKRFFSKWYNRPGELVICCGSLSWLTIRKGSTLDNTILDALSLTNHRIAKSSMLIVITENIDDDNLHELWRRLSPHGAIEIYEVERRVIEKYSFSRYAAAGDSYQYIIKYNEEDRDGYILEHTAVSEKAFIDNLIEESRVPEKRKTLACAYCSNAAQSPPCFSG